ncbi:hypothetical protein AJ78_06622 [Emergomyces pasteurianus Ep9510]|uniref:ER transporter 6TM N-terminal domain-containing protein n=1 Tax=Emergomyces pasteurianus Ep9510 TaxID=1447872 RepID=A0A1J9PA69_9EURO|nr:hypothetical protein AJ78_06622 [Emergomyces pasteurianus Ep9510]
MGTKRKKIRKYWRHWTLRRAWASLGLDTHTVLMMMKGGLPPTIAIAMYQSTRVANLTENYGYLSATVAVLVQCLNPRAMFMKIMFFNFLAMCTAASLGCLGLFSAVRARQHTTPVDASEDARNGYNSSACAVSAVWFLFDIWIGNTLRNYRPSELQQPMVIFSIFVAIVMTRVAQIVTISEGLYMIRGATLAFTVGLTIATGVSLFVFPVTSRSKLFRGLRPFPNTVKSLLNAQIAYVRRSEKEGPWKLTRTATLTGYATFGSILSRQATAAREGAAMPQDKHSQALKTAMNGLNSMYSTLHDNLYYAKQEMAWGKLTSEDLDALVSLLRSILVSFSGIGMLPEIFRKLSKPINNTHNGVDERLRQDSAGSSSESEYDEHDGGHFIGPLCARLESAAELVYQGIQHAMITLEISKVKDFPTDIKRQRFTFVARDEEAAGDPSGPGGEGFAALFETKLQEFFDQKSKLPETWATLNAFTSVNGGQGYRNQGQEDREIRKEFFVIILIGHLQELLLQATLNLVKFADDKVADGTMKSYKFIFPKREAMKEWFSFRETAQDGDGNSRASNQSASDAFKPVKVATLRDPDHLPPTNSWQRFGDFIRSISHILRSEQSGFGLRVALASFCVAILAYLDETQDVFYDHRLNWAAVIVILAMSPTSGKSLFGLMTRIAATTLSMGLGLAVWYIAAGRTAGVIVFLYIANCIQHYFIVKYPRFISTVIIALITFNLIIAYELQNRKLGLQRASAGGLRTFPIYIFGPYRLAAVVAGCFVAFIWTIFPYPISASSQVRRCLGRSLFVLANFYSCMHTTIEVWIQQEQGDITDPHSPTRILERVRMKLFAKELALLADMRTHSEFSLYEPPIGGRFPKYIYDNIASEIQAILASMDIMAYATRDLESMTPRSFSATSTRYRRSRASTDGGCEEENQEDRKMWIHTLARAADTSDFHSQIATSVLCHLSAAVTNGLSLPPYLSPPHPFPLARRLRRMNASSMDISNMEDPSFAAFVSIEVMSSMVSSSLKNLVSNVRKLVGELNFEVYVQSHRDRARTNKSRATSIETRDSRRRPKPSGNEDEKNRTEE